MTPPAPSSSTVAGKLELAYELIHRALCQAPQMRDYGLDHALLVLILSMRKARRLRHARAPVPPGEDPQASFWP